MSRYVIKFSKEGNIRYISHLDLLRLFKRSFKRAGIRLIYSQGFNPHPKMSFAQPLSLGYSSSGEYLEFDTTEPYPTEFIRESLGSIMPGGISIFSCSELPVTGKTLASLTEAASYEVFIPLAPDVQKDIKAIVHEYHSQDKILVMKHQRKTGKDLEIDIKPMIMSIEGMVCNNNIMITMRLSAGSTANLSPEMVLSSFSEYAKVPYDRAEVPIHRTELYFQQ